eukprot:m.226498 g.226498  ORF g.226498 m.226498 type:complete len:126 (-) comp15657_c0_seq3:542-919(-)
MLDRAHNISLFYFLFSSSSWGGRNGGGAVACGGIAVPLDLVLGPPPPPSPTANPGRTCPPPLGCVPVVRARDRTSPGDPHAAGQRGREQDLQQQHAVDGIRQVNGAESKGSGKAHFDPNQSTSTG